MPPCMQDQILQPFPGQNRFLVVAPSLQCLPGEVDSATAINDAGCHPVRLGASDRGHLLTDDGLMAGS